MNPKNAQLTHAQHGFSLVIVLILILIMMIMGTALFRSTLVGSMIAGNSAAKNATSQAGNIGLVVAQKIIDTALPTATGNGFSLTALAVDSHGLPTATTAATASNAATATTAVPWYPATPTAVIADGGVDTGYKYQYVIEKLCNTAGVCTQSTSTGTVTGCGIEPNSPTPCTSSTATNLYRVTVRVTGPQSLESYVQAIYGK